MSKLNFYNFKQRSEEWEAIRVGKVGGSEAIGLTTPARLKTLVYLKMAEIQTGEQEDFFVSKAMQDGIDNEPIAIALYEKQTFSNVIEAGYITNSDYKYLGLSGDGFVGLEVGVEVKCPMPKQHCMTIMEGVVPAANRPQIAQYFLINTNLKRVDFVSYNEKVKAKPLFVIECTREEFETDIKKLEKGYKDFEAKIDSSMDLFKS